MKLALIPPFSHLDYTTLTDYQLLLPQLITQSPLYRYTYQTYCAADDQFVIMDNGAAEGEQLTDVQLIRIANTFKPNELVMPDVLRDGDATFDRITAFLRTIINHPLDPSINLGIVAAGKSVKESYNLIQKAWTYFGDQIKTVFIPRSLLQDASAAARLELAPKIRILCGTRPNIHFLGSSYVWIAEAKFAARDLPFLRGIDTSAPFNYTIAQWRIDNGSQVKRPDGYFSRTCQNPELLDFNVRKYREWVEDGLT